MNTREQFFALLRGGLWGEAANPPDFPAGTDWEAIFRLAQQQTVEAVVYDGLLMLPADLYPEPPLLRQWCARMARIEQSHELINQGLAEVTTRLQEEGVHPVLLKGQGVARNYPLPHHRHCGDIDLYIGAREYKRVCRIVQQWGIDPAGNSENSRHYDFRFKGIIVELHRVAQRLNNPFRNRTFQRWTTRHLAADQVKKEHVGETEVWLPPANFDALYIFSHAFQHFMQGGVGLRQFCDWARYLHRFNHDINREALTRDLTAFGLMHAWRLFSPVAVEYLGLPEEEMPLYTPCSPRKTNTILGHILKDGNFGFHGQASQPPKGYLGKKLHSLKRIQKRLWKLFPLFPKEVISHSVAHLIEGTIQVIKDRS